jgi:hypothetical protein
MSDYLRPKTNLLTFQRAKYFVLVQKRTQPVEASGKMG